MDIELVIEELIVDGSFGLDGTEIRRSIESELGRLLGEDSGGLLSRRRSGDLSDAVELLDEPTAENEALLGRQIAAAIHKCITT